MSFVLDSTLKGIGGMRLENRKGSSCTRSYDQIIKASLRKNFIEKIKPYYFLSKKTTLVFHVKTCKNALKKSQTSTLIAKTRNKN